MQAMTKAFINNCIPGIDNLRYRFNENYMKGAVYWRTYRRIRIKVSFKVKFKKKGHQPHQNLQNCKKVIVQ